MEGGAWHGAMSSAPLWVEAFWSVGAWAAGGGWACMGRSGCSGTLAFGKEAMGLGDVHLMGAIGAVIGAGDACLAVAVAPVVALVWYGVSATAAALGGRSAMALPFGPHLALSSAVVLVFGEWVWRAIALLAPAGSGV
ncbi:MAG: hypothetical protein HC927_07035 [Deltaproteobacteria bacterium]|nr:hypothetical protein [Deltaproteobacteria bacterium]